MRKHGLRNSPEYNVWRSMKKRCFVVTESNYDHYGGAGITVCDRWRDSFSAFYEDMGQRPSPAHSIDRFPNGNGNYEPGNCRWATTEEQNRNRPEYNVVVSFHGRSATIAEWAEVLKMSTDALYWRICRANWPTDRALSEPVHYGARLGRVASDAARRNMSTGQRRRHAHLEVK
jgi:hypothetical protein